MPGMATRLNHCLALLWLLGPAAAQTLELKILDPHGLAVAGARVEVRGPHASRSAVTDERGTATVQVELPAEIRVAAVGFEPLAERLGALPAKAAELRLRPAVIRTSVEVVVRDERMAAQPTVGSALEIERRGARTVFDAVEQLVPGAFVTRRGVMGYGIATNGTGVVTLRGVGGQPNTGVLVVIDGRPDFQGLMGHPVPDFYSLSDADSVSVTEGPASVLYGSNAMGGVIEIKPALPSERSQGRLSTSLGSYLTGLHRFAYGARLGRSFYSLAGGVAHTRGERPSAAFRSQDAAAAFGYDLSPGWKASLEGRYGHFHVEDPGPEQAPLAGSYARVGRGGFSLHLDNARASSWGQASLYSAHGRHIISDGFRSTDRTTGARLHQSFALTRQLVAEAGADLATYGGGARNVLSRADYGSHRLNSAAGFTRLQWAANAQTRLNAGLRYDHHSLLGALVVPEFGAMRNLWENYAVSVAVGRGFRSPTIRELYLFPAPNPRLKPERLWSYQATLHIRPHSNLAAWGTLYYSDLSNMIVTLGRFPNLKLENASRALNRGWEGNARWSPRARIRLNAGYAWLHSTNLSPLVPEHKWNYSVDVDAAGAFIHLGGITVGRRWTDLARSRQLGGYTLATLKCSVPVRRRWSVSLMLDNLLNRRYEVLSGYPMPGINATGGMSVQF